MRTIPSKELNKIKRTYGMKYLLDLKNPANFSYEEINSKLSSHICLSDLFKAVSNWDLWSFMCIRYSLKDETIFEFEEIKDYCSKINTLFGIKYEILSHNDHIYYVLRRSNFISKEHFLIACTLLRYPYEKGFISIVYRFLRKYPMFKNKWDLFIRCHKGNFNYGHSIFDLDGLGFKKINQEEYFNNLISMRTSQKEVTKKVFRLNEITRKN
jgi:hypothetical protein